MVGCVLQQNSVKWNVISDTGLEIGAFPNAKMITKVTLFLFFLSGVAVSFIFTVLPNISSLFTTQTQQLDSSFVASCRSKPDSQQLILDTLKRYQTSITAQRKDVQKKSRELTAEAMASLSLAKEMWHEGKTDKALKLFQHAFALDPSSPDILNEYGEFLESTQKDVVKAEHMYCRALVISPEHTKAMSNRKRTLPLVEEIDQSTFNRLDDKRDILVKVPDSHPGLRRMKKENYIKHIYHTTAIEGNTFTLAQTRSFVETNMVVAGKSIQEHNEIIGLDSALSYINSTLVHRIGDITVDDILDIHRRVLGHVDPVGSGHFRTTQVFVGNHIPPGPAHVQSLVDEFVDWLNADEALNLHVIEFAALAHYKLVYIHPFYDGNGRTSRLLMNLILMQAGYPPIIVRVEDKHEYYQHLETANNGDVRPFIRFIARCTERTLDEYLLGSVENINIKLPSLADTRPLDDGRTIILEDANEP